MAFIGENVTVKWSAIRRIHGAPEGKSMGHAGGIVSGSAGTAQCQEGSPRSGRREGRQDPVRDHSTAARGHRMTDGPCGPSTALSPGTANGPPTRDEVRPDDQPAHPAV